ncbi:MAG TPA: hypothetical protein VIY53_10195 [Acidobacteriaceae bacterium]
MQIESASLRAGVMARRIALLAVVALALGAVTFVLARSSVEQAPTAELSFNPDAAYHDDFALTGSGQPAVAAAQAILSDALVLDLLQKAGASIGDGAHVIGDFRSRLDLTEPWLETLEIRYRDPDPRTAAVAANAVATALAEGSPPARAPPARHPKGSARAAIPAWENPYRIMRLASVPPRILADPLWLAAGIAAVFFAAGLFGGFLVWHRARQAAYSEDRVAEGIGFTLLPPMVVGQRAQEFVTVRLEAAEAIHAAEPEEAGEPAEPVSSAAGEPTAQLPLVFQVSGAEESGASFWPGPPPPVQPGVMASVVEAASAASAFPREAETAKLPEMSGLEARREVASDDAARPTAEPAVVDEPADNEAEDVEKPEGMEGGRISLADPGAGDAVWSERILLGFAGTSIGQMLEAERRRDGRDRMPRRPPESATDAGDAREPERA